MRRSNGLSRAGGVVLAAGLILFAGCDRETELPTAPEVTSETAEASGPELGDPGSSIMANGYMFIPPVYDDAGPNDVPEQSDVNWFTRADNVADWLGVKWAWDDIDQWTGSGQTGDVCGLFDTDLDGFANFSLCVRIENNADGSEVFQLPAGESPLIYECSDKKIDRCSKQVSVLQSIGGTTCSVIKETETAPPAPWVGDDGADVVATCFIDLSAVPKADRTNLLNVCSFPSGSPNSNPFDCVVTPGAGFIQIQKVTTPTSSQAFNFTLAPAATDGETSFQVAGSNLSDGPGSSPLIPVSPNDYSLAESLTEATGWQFSSASCSDGSGPIGTPNGADGVTDIQVQTGQTVTCTFNNTLPPGISVTKTAKPTSVPETGGEVEYTVLVANTSGAAVTLSSLSDDKFGDVADATNKSINSTTCSVPQTLAAAGQTGDSYTCSFKATLVGDAGREDHTNWVTASASSAAGSTTAKDDATVSFGDVLPKISVTKTPSTSEVPETGRDVTYTVVVKNEALEAATLTKLLDDIFGDLTDGSNTKLKLTDCKVPQSLAAKGQSGDSYSCKFTAFVAGTPGIPHVNTVTATATDDDGNETTATGKATVGLGAVDPTLTLTKTADPTSVPETGGDVTFTIKIVNTSAETVTLTLLEDDKFGDLNGKGTCSVPQTLQPSGVSGDEYSCSFSEHISGDAGSHTNVAKVTGNDDDGTETTAQDDETVTLVDVLPDITVTKDASQTSVPETGGDVSYTVKVVNNSDEPVRLSSLSDDKFGNLHGQGTCFVPQTLAASGGAGDSYSCSFTRSLSSSGPGDHVNTVTAVGTDNEGNTDTETDDATVTFTDVKPDIAVTKTASPTSVLETGGDVTFTVTAINNSDEPVKLSSLTDDKFGNLHGQGDCSVPQDLAASGEAGDSYSCTFTKSLSGSSTIPHTNTVTAVGTDNEGNTDTETDDATVTFTEVLPVISVTKTASPTSVAETGGQVSYTVDVSNKAGESVTVTDLTDDKFGDLNGQGTCSVPKSLLPGASFSCSFSKTISGNAGTSHVNTVTATGKDDDGNSTTANDDATVSFTDVKPDITVTKTVDPTTLGGSGSSTAGTPAGLVSSAFVTANGFLFIPPVYDDGGPNDTPEQSDLNWFTRADNIAGQLGVRWAWDDTDMWTGTGQTGDACGLFDIDADGFANFALCVQITNSADGLSVIQLPSEGVVFGYECSDKKTDRCSKQVSPIPASSLGGTTCTVSKQPETMPPAPWLGDDGEDVVAECDIDLVSLGVTESNLLNVCSFPSGEPNSNPFDCVVTPGAGFLLIEKTAAGTSQSFDFTFSPAATDGSTGVSVAAGSSSALIPVIPVAGGFTVTESQTANWNLASASCSDGSGPTGLFNSTTDAVTGIQVQTGQTVTCTFDNVWAFTGPVTYTIVVTNNSLEPATLDSLDDDKFGNLDGQGTCALTQALAASGQSGASYTCKFVKTLSGGAGETHTNTVTAKASDDEANTDTETDEATVTFSGPY
jgi:hypothetical protein